MSGNPNGSPLPYGVSAIGVRADGLDADGSKEVASCAR